MDVTNIAYVKAFHIVFVVTWFAGLFYIVRLFVYHTEAEEKPENEKQILQNQYKIMEKRLWYIIAWPSAILTIVLGLTLVHVMNYWAHPWMHLKLGLVFGLFLYHLKCHQIYNQLQNDVVKITSGKMRLLNEVSVLFLIAIVFVVVLKSMLDWVWGVVGIMAIGVCLMIAIKWYKKRREANASQEEAGVAEVGIDDPESDEGSGLKE